MYRGAYLTGLLFALVALAVVDARLKLALWRDTRKTLATVAIGVAFFLLWDIVGIANHVFYIGKEQVLTGVRLLPELPIEEPIFLLLLMYLTLILWQSYKRWHARYI